VNEEFEGSGRDLILRYYSDIRLEGLRKTTQDLGQDFRSPGRDLNWRSLEYEAGVLSTRPRRCER
jgi:hypothetical protein